MARAEAEGNRIFQEAFFDFLKTRVAKGVGATAVLNRSYGVFAQACGSEVDPCRPRKESDTGKAERSVRRFRQSFGGVFRQDWASDGALQAALDQRALELMDRLNCPVTGTSVGEALEAERMVLQPLPTMAALRRGGEEGQPGLPDLVGRFLEDRPETFSAYGFSGGFGREGKRERPF